MSNMSNLLVTKRDAKQHRAFLSASESQTGATLIEIVVALLIFSIGALGIASLQTASIVRTDDTKQRSIAIWKAQEFVDRMRSTKTSQDPDGRIDLYIAAINNDNSDNGIGAFNTNDVYTCPNTPPTRCDSGNNTTTCVVFEPPTLDAAGNVDPNVPQNPIPDDSAEVLVDFDVWSILCDPNSGLVANTVNDGSVGLRQLEVALEEVALAGTDTEYRLYFEWLSRSANNNLDDNSDGNNTDTGLLNTDGSARLVTTNLCGDDEMVDSRLDTYCVRFE